jgi:hypothetical protein
MPRVHAKATTDAYRGLPQVATQISVPEDIEAHAEDGNGLYSTDVRHPHEFCLVQAEYCCVVPCATQVSDSQGCRRGPVSRRLSRRKGERTDILRSEQLFGLRIIHHE